MAHDYLTQRGGAERVVLAICRALNDPPVVTSLYEPATTFADFAGLDVRTTPLQRLRWFRRHHRWALPFYAFAFSRIRVDAELVVCSTSGWAHAVRTTGPKVVYVHNTARWLYQSDEYLRRLHPRVRRWVDRGLAPLRRWDRSRASTATLLLTNSESTQARISAHWGREATVLHPPHGADPEGPATPVPGIEPGYLLVVSRLLAYKRVDLAVEAMRDLGDQRLVVVGRGPERQRLVAAAPPNCHFLAEPDDAELRWLYANCSALVVAGVEDFGLVPLEAMAFGKPVVGRRGGGLLETIVEGETGVLFDEPTVDDLAQAIRASLSANWDRTAIQSRAARFNEAAFAAHLRAYVTALRQADAMTTSGADLAFRGERC